MTNNIIKVILVLADQNLSHLLGDFDGECNTISFVEISCMFVTQSDFVVFTIYILQSVHSPSFTFTILCRCLIIRSKYAS